MKKLLAFGGPLLCAVAGAAGLRYWQRVTAFEDTGLVAPGAAATWCLVCFLLLCAVGFALLSRRLLGGGGRRLAGGEPRKGYLPAFALPHRAMILVYLLSGGLLVAAGLLALRDARLGTVDYLSYKVLAVALVPTGLDLALVGWLGAQKQEGQGRFAWPLLLPGWCGCVWLISAYQLHAAQPAILTYAFYFLGALCAVGACYYLAAFSFERPRPMTFAWMGAMALVLLTTAVVDGVMEQDTHRALVCLGYMVYLAVQLKCLLYRSAVSAKLEPWEAPEDEEEITEVSDHE